MHFLLPLCFPLKLYCLQQAVDFSPPNACQVWVRMDRTRKKMDGVGEGQMDT